MNVLVGVAMWLFSAPPSFPALSTEEKRTAMTFGLKLLKVSFMSAVPATVKMCVQVYKEDFYLICHLCFRGVVVIT